VLSKVAPQRHESAFNGEMRVQELQIYFLAFKVTILKVEAVIFITPKRELVSLMLP
jgi:hypothetical protein